MGLSPTWPGGGGTYPLTFDGTSTPPLHSSRVLPLTDQLSDDATCRLPRCSRLPPSPSSGLFQQQLSPALAWWEPFTPETRPSSPCLRPYFSELKACTTLDANVKALSSDAPSETDPAPFSQSSQLSYVLIPASNLSMGPISTPPPALTPLGVPIVFQDPLPYPLPRTRCQLPPETSDPGIQAAGETTLQPPRIYQTSELPHSTWKHCSVSINSCTSCIQSSVYSFL